MRLFRSSFSVKWQLKNQTQIMYSKTSPENSKQEQTRLFTQKRSSSNRGSSRTGFRVQEVITPLLLCREAGARPLEDALVEVFLGTNAPPAVRVLLRPLEAVACTIGCPCTIAEGRGADSRVVVLERLLWQPFSCWRPTYAISWACDLRTCPTSWDTFRDLSKYRAHKKSFLPISCSF